MAEDSWPSPTHPAVTDPEFEPWAVNGQVSGLLGNQTFLPLVYADNTGRSVKVRAGRYATVRGRTWYSGTSETTLTIAANGSGQPRIDLVVLRLDRANYNIRLAVLQGTPGASPAAPSTTNTATAFNSGIWELPLARVSVAAGASTLAAGTVSPVAWYIADDGSVQCTSSTRPSTSMVSLGTRMTETDTGKVYINVNGSWFLIAEDTGWLNLSPLAGWTTTYARYRKRDGVVYLATGLWTRTGGNLPASTDSNLTVALPAEFLPSVTIPVVGYIAGAHIVRGEVSIAGQLRINDYFSTPVNTGQDLRMAATSWPV